MATGASFTAVTFTVEVTPVEVCAPTASEFASVTAQVIVREVAVLFTVGSSELELNVTLRSAVWYCATVAVPVSVSTPPAKLPVIPFCVTKPSVSPATGLPIVTVAE